MFWLMRFTSSVKDMFEMISFLKREFKKEWPKEQNIKCCPWFVNVGHVRQRYRQNNSDNNYGQVSILSALSQRAP